MGLDQYFYKRKIGDKEQNYEEIGYLRKANALQRYFEARFNLQNLMYLEIDGDTIDDLEKRLEGTNKIFAQFAKDEAELEVINEYDNTDDFEKMSQLLSLYIEQENEIEKAMRKAHWAGEAFYPCWGDFYGDDTMSYMLLWQLPQIREAIRAVIEAYDNLGPDESIVYIYSC